MSRIAPAPLQDFATDVLIACGITADDARIVARHLVAADLAGVPSHGVGQLVRYCTAIDSGRVNLRPRMTHSATGAILHVDGDGAFGFVVAEQAMALAIGAAGVHGVGLALVRNSSHFGRGAPYAMQAAKAGMIGVVLSNAAPTVALLGGRTPEIGTNPIAFAAPAGASGPFLYDMAITGVARGRLRRAAEAGEALAEGIAVRPDGQPARTAAEAMAGVLLPFGGFKGANIAMTVEILAGVLSGAAVGREVRGMHAGSSGPAGTGHFLMAIDIAAIMPLAAFEARLRGWLDGVAARAAADGAEEVRLPGIRAATTTQANMDAGVALSQATRRALAGLAGRVGVAVPDWASP